MTPMLGRRPNWAGDKGHRPRPERERSSDRAPPARALHVGKHLRLRDVRVRRSAGCTPLSDAQSGWAEWRGEYDGVGLCRTRRRPDSGASYRHDRNRHDGQGNEPISRDRHDGRATTRVETRASVRRVRVIVLMRRIRHAGHRCHRCRCAVPRHARMVGHGDARRQDEHQSQECGQEPADHVTDPGREYSMHRAVMAALSRPARRART